MREHAQEYAHGGVEDTLDLDGQKIAMLRFGDLKGLPVLALHGWLDNGASFARLAPLLPDIHWMAVDLPGHGRSQHRSGDLGYLFCQWLPVVAQIIDHIKPRPRRLIGHSMGAGIALMTAAVQDLGIEGVFCLEGFGPLTSKDAAIVQTVNAAYRADTARKKRMALEEAAGHGPAAYPNLAAMVQAYRDAVPGLGLEGARILVARSAYGDKAGGWRWRSDPRLRMPSWVRFTEAQILALLQALQMPVAGVRTHQGYPFPEELLARRLGMIDGLVLDTVEGGHHVHLDAPQRVVEPILKWLERV